MAAAITGQAPHLLPPFLTDANSAAAGRMPAAATPIECGAAQTAVSAMPAFSNRSSQSDAAGRLCFTGFAADGSAAALRPPIVADRDSRGSELVMEETFGPVIPVMRAPDDDAAAIARFNATDDGLSAGLCANDRPRMDQFVSGLKAGTVNLCEAPGFRFEMSPFGGVLDSGLGHKEGVIPAMKSDKNVKTLSLAWG